MELRQLKYFLAVADARSFVSAAARLYISRQAISKAIAQLEAELNTELFMRDSSGAFLTPAGVMFYERVRNNVLELEQLRTQMQQLGSRFRQTFRVVFSIGTLGLFESSLDAFSACQSNITVTAEECAPQMCASLLTERHADVAITPAELDPSIFSQHVLLESPFGLAVLNSSESPRHMKIGCMNDGQSEAVCKEMGMAPYYTGLDMGRLISLALQGRCAVLLPQCLFPAYVSGLQFHPLPSDRFWQLRRVCLQSLESNALFYNALEDLTRGALIPRDTGR